MTLHIREPRQTARPIRERRERGAEGSARSLAGQSAGAIRRPGVAIAARSNVRLHKTSTPTCGKPGTALPSPGPQISLGATRVGALLSRLEMHLGTARFLAELRQDALWQASCEDAALTLARLASGMTPVALDASLRSRIATGQRERVPRVAANFAPVVTGVPAIRMASRLAAPSPAARCAVASTALAHVALRRAARSCKRVLAARDSAKALSVRRSARALAAPSKDRR
jgi:hypothetical protein